MRKLIVRIACAFPLVLLFAAGAFAQCPSQTPNIGFQVPNIGNTTSWGTCLNGDLSTLDNLLGGSVVFPVGTATAPISQHSNWVTANVAPQTVTNITGGFPGQTIRIFCGVSDTFTSIAASATISVLSTWSCSSQNSISLTFIGTVWYEIGRQTLPTPASPITGCTTGGGVLYENGTNNIGTCNANFKYSPTGTWWEISQNGSDNSTIEGNMAIAGHPLLQLVAATAGPLGASIQLDAFNHIVEFGPGGTNFATAIEGQSQGSGVPLASTGTYRMSKASSECWRNNANSADNCLAVNSLDQLAYNGVSLQSTAFTSTAISVSGNAVLTPVANVTQLASFYISNPISVLNRIQYHVGSVGDNSANLYDIGVYGPNCDNGATGVPLVFHTGAQPGTVLMPTTATAMSIALAGAPVSVNIPPGFYCLAITSNAAVNARLNGELTGIHDLQFANASSPQGTTGNTTGGLLNSTITAPVAGWLSGAVIFVTGF